MLRRSTLLIPAFSMIGCAAYLHAMAPKPRIASNPLVSHQPLVDSQKASLGTLSEQDCPTWPFENTVKVEVTAAQICIEAHENKQAPPGWHGEPTANSSKGFQVANDANQGGYINARKTNASKVATCFDKGFNQNTAIWAFDYRGCAPNNGTVTAATKSLTVGDKSWQFSTATAPATTASNDPS